MDRLSNFLQKLRWHLRGHVLRWKGTNSPRSRRHEDKEYEERLCKLVLEDIRDLLELKPEDKLIDIGCADGYLTQGLRSSVSSVTGIDRSSSLISLAKERHKIEGLSFRVGDVLSLSFDDATFDKVCCYSMLQYVCKADLSRVLTELTRITKPDGHILLGDIFDKSKEETFADVILSDSQISIPGHLVYWLEWLSLKLLNPVTMYEREDFTSLAKSMGLDVQFHEQRKDFPYSAICYDVVLRKSSITN